MNVGELVAKLQELPPDWSVYATKSGGSLEFSEGLEAGQNYGYVFTDGRPTLRLTRRRGLGMPVS